MSKDVHIQDTFAEENSENSLFSLNLKFSLLDFSKENDMRIIMYIKIEGEKNS